MPPEEAIRNIKEAIQGYIAALQEDGLPIAHNQLDLVDGSFK